MPQHDLPDGHETESNLIDFRKHLRARIQLSAQDNDDPAPEASDWDVYRHAEHSDGKRPGFTRYDLLWVGLILSFAALTWLLIVR